VFDAGGHHDELQHCATHCGMSPGLPPDSMDSLVLEGGMQSTQNPLYCSAQSSAASTGCLSMQQQQQQCAAYALQ